MPSIMSPMPLDFRWTTGMKWISCRFSGIAGQKPDIAENGRVAAQDPRPGSARITGLEPGSVDGGRPSDPLGIPFTTAFSPLQAGCRPAAAEAEHGRFDSSDKRCYRTEPLRVPPRSCIPRANRPPSRFRSAHAQRSDPVVARHRLAGAGRRHRHRDRTVRPPRRPGRSGAGR